MTRGDALSVRQQLHEERTHGKHKRCGLCPIEEAHQAWLYHKASEVREPFLKRVVAKWKRFKAER